MAAIPPTERPGEVLDPSENRDGKLRDGKHERPPHRVPRNVAPRRSRTRWHAAGRGVGKICDAVGVTCSLPLLTVLVACALDSPSTDAAAQGENRPASRGESTDGSPTVARGDEPNPGPQPRQRFGGVVAGVWLDDESNLNLIWSPGPRQWTLEMLGEARSACEHPQPSDDNLLFHFTGDQQLRAGQVFELEAREARRGLWWGDHPGARTDAGVSYLLRIRVRGVAEDGRSAELELVYFDDVRGGFSGRITASVCSVQG